MWRDYEQSLIIFFFLQKLNYPLKLATERFEPEMLRRSTLLYPKPKPLGQPKWVKFDIFYKDQNSDVVRGVRGPLGSKGLKMLAVICCRGYWYVNLVCVGGRFRHHR